MLWVLEKGFNDSITIKTINIKKENQERFNFKLEDKTNSEVSYSLPLTYLYETNSAILKSGAFKSISNRFNISKIHKHSHLYTSKELIDFSGRCFKIEKVIHYNKKSIKKLGISKANITIRNFPATVQKVRQGFNIKDGGQRYLFFTTNINNDKIVIVCYKTS